MYCKNCGKQLSKDAKFCDRCGTGVKSDQYTEKVEYRDKHVSILKGIGLIIFIFIIVAGIVLGLWTVKENIETREKIVGTYIGEMRNWILQINEDYTVSLDNKIGVCYEDGENSWEIRLDNTGSGIFYMTATLSEDGNILITSEDEKWIPEIFYKEGISENLGKSMNLDEMLGFTVEELKLNIPQEEYNKFEKEAYLENGYGMSNSEGTSISIQNDIVSRISIYSEKYSIHNIKIGTEAEAAKRILLEDGFVLGEKAGYSETYVQNYIKDEIVIQVINEAGKVICVIAWIE